MKKNNILIITVLVTLFYSLLLISCEDEIQSWELTPNISHSDVGIILMHDEDNTPADTLHLPHFFDHGLEVKISAKSTQIGWIFSHWQGDLTGSDNPTEIVMDDHKSIIAFFRLEDYKLSISINGNGTVIDEAIVNKLSDYDYGTEVKLTALPDTGWVFDHWEGDLTGTDNPASLVIDSEKNVTAVFKRQQYPLTISINGNGTVIDEAVVGKISNYAYGTEVKLTALPDTGWVFDRWEVDINGSSNPVTLTIDDNKSITAVFTEIPYTVNISSSGSGSVNKNPDQSSYHYNNTVQLTANPNIGWTFDHWEGNLTGSDNPVTLTVDGNKSLTAVFVEVPYSVSTSIEGNGSVSKDPDQNYYNYNSTVQLTANPNTGWSFDHWEGGLTGSDNPVTLTVDGNKSLTAVFVEVPYSVNTSAVGNGSVSKNPNQSSYNYNSTVQLTANPNAGWSFDHWEGDLTGSVNPVTLTVDGNKSLTAVFVDESYETENVIIVVMDGARYSETWGDPSHQYIPYMSNYMSNKGVINTNFHNMEETITTSGHIYMTTGVYQVSEGKSKDYPYYPSIFQYWLKENSSTSNDAWVITSKDKLEALGNCQLSNWKDKYLPNTNCGINGAGTGYRDDSVTYSKTINILSTYKPNLVLVNFKEPDVSGHIGIWDNYVQSIGTTDKYVYEIWNYINTNPHYKGKTTMFVTNDHGRHLDSVYGGFKNHGDGCEGCRHVNFYAYGPDFKNGTTVSKKRGLIDISATISELLDFSIPYGDGKIMSELFK